MRKNQPAKQSAQKLQQICNVTVISRDGREIHLTLSQNSINTTPILSVLRLKFAKRVGAEIGDLGEKMKNYAQK